MTDAARWPMAWLVWRQGERGPEFYGLVPSDQAAQAAIASMRSLRVHRHREGWQTAALPLVGQDWEQRIRELSQHVVKPLPDADEPGRTYN